ncbi:MAG: hypothetical protein JWL60_2535 [Gemmatimonadetes bacterium]|jgi:hypothetical protein|nr:hypothetical protein [Gemmatimonadota bacterium]
MGVDPVWIPILGIGMIPVMAIGIPLARAFAKRMEAGTQRVTMPPEATARLERMEQAIDAIAVEIERISENQRFTTKLLSDRSPAALPHSPDAAERS